MCFMQLQIQDGGMPIHVPDGLYAIYHVIPGFESTQSINMFQTYGGFPYVTDEKETITAFVQIVNQSKNGKQTVSIRWPVNGCFLSMYHGLPIGCVHVSRQQMLMIQTAQHLCYFHRRIATVESWHRIRAM